MTLSGHTFSRAITNSFSPALSPDSTAGPVDVPGPADGGTEGVFHGIRDVHAWHALRSIRHLPQRQGGQGPGQVRPFWFSRVLDGLLF